MAKDAAVHEARRIKTQIKTQCKKQCKTQIKTRQACRWAILPACLMLWGCPEQLTPDTSGGAAPETSSAPPTPPTSPRSTTTTAAPSGTSQSNAPTANGDVAAGLVPKPEDTHGSTGVYRGTLSFGGTVVVALNQPVAGKVTISFEDSPFGLAGSLIGNLRVTPGRMVVPVSSVTADSSNPPPDAVIAALPGISFRFGLENGNLRGDIEGLPNIALAQAGDGVDGGVPGGLGETRHPGSALLAGLIHAVDTRSAPALASLAGTYNYIVEAARYPSGSPAPLPGTQLAQVGQLRIDSDGKLSTCPNQPYAEGCKPIRSGDATMGAWLRPADQTRHPGQFEVVDEGVVVGRLFVQDNDGKWNLRMLQRQTVSSGVVRLGTWVMQAVTPPMQEGQLDGSWACREVGIDRALRGLNPPGLDGSMDEMQVDAKKDEMWIDEMRSRGTAPLKFNVGFRVADPSKPETDLKTPLPGMVHALWTQSASPLGTRISREQVMLPLDRGAFVYLREVDEAAGEQSESAVWGLCVKHATKRPPR